MKISNAVRNAWKAYTASFTGTLVFLVIETCLTLICLAPLLFLTKGGLAAGALLTPVLWIFVMLPARMNAALAMRASLRGGSLGSRVLGDASDYGQKLLCGLKRAGFLLLWAAPLTALAAVGWNYYSGNTDSLSVLRMIRKGLGGGDQIRGVLVLILMVVAALLIFLFGCAFHSGARHAFARNRIGIIRGHHGGILLAWGASLMCILPLLACLVIIVFRYLPVVTNLTGFLTGLISMPSTSETLAILIAGAVLTLPLLPLRSLIPAAYVSGLEDRE